MNDAENLSQLLGHLPPAVFRSFMAAKCRRAFKSTQRCALNFTQGL